MNNNYFTFDACYRKPSTITDSSFERHLTNNFYKSSVKSVEECQTQSLRNNSDFFLINDINTSLNNTITNCYIPKISNSNQTLFGSNTERVRGQQFIFDSLFKSDNTIAPYIKQETPNPMDICNTLMFNQNKNVADTRCFRYTLDSQVYTPRKYYAYYKKPILNAENINRLNSIKHPSDYSNNLVTLQSYKELLRIDIANPENNSDLVAAFEKYICSNSPSDRELLTTEINNLKQVYNDFRTKLNEIKMDLSSINYINSFDDDALKALNLSIASKKHELNGLLGSGGANNGRLDDTTLLTQFKIVENSILLLLIICAIFFLTKSKKTILAS
jgi:hypothetical protein